MTDYYVDSVNGSDSNDGLTVNSPKATLTQINALSGDLSGVTIYLGKGSTWRDQLNFGNNAVYGSAGSRLKITSYGDGEKPILNGSDLCAGFVADTTTDSLGRLYKKTGVTSGQNIFYTGMGGADKRVPMVAWNTNAATTFATMSEGTASYDAVNNVIYVWLPSGVSPNGVAEITNRTNALKIATTNGHVDVSGIHATKARDDNISIATIATSSPTDILVHDNTSDYAGFDDSAVDTSGDGIIVNGDSINRMTSLYVYNNDISYCMNNAVEFSYVTGAVVYYNRSHDCGGNLCELWADCVNTKIYRNWAKDHNTKGRLFTAFNEAFAWTAPTASSGGTLTDGTKVIGNVGINMRVRSIRHNQGSLDCYNNVFIGCENRGLDCQNIDSPASQTINFKNNVMGINDTDFGAFPRAIYLDAAATNNLDNNLYYIQNPAGDNVKYYNGTSSILWAGYSAAEPNSNEVSISPFADEQGEDLSLSTGHAMLGAGAIYWGSGSRPQAWNGELFDTQSPDVGAYQLPGAFYPGKYE